MGLSNDIHQNDNPMIINHGILMAFWMKPSRWTAGTAQVESIIRHGGLVSGRTQDAGGWVNL